MSEQLSRAFELLTRFSGGRLADKLNLIEQAAPGVTPSGYADFIGHSGVSRELLQAGRAVKAMVGPIDTLIHAVGILTCLPHVLAPGEVVEYLSLGSENTGRRFDLESDKQIAEFKFITWRGGPETRRQNDVFKDFVALAEQETSKRRCLYLDGTTQALAFLEGGRALASAIGGSKPTAARISHLGLPESATVGEYFAARRERVEVIDVGPWLDPALERALP